MEGGKLLDLRHFWVRHLGFADLGAWNAGRIESGGKMGGRRGMRADEGGGKRYLLTFLDL